MNKQIEGWKFIGTDGDFSLDSPERSSYLYFPLANEAGMMASVTPTLNGDAKSGQNSFLLAPVSAEDLHNSRSARNFWFYIHGKGAWSAVGRSPRQLAQEAGDEATRLEAGFLWHKLTRNNRQLGVKAELTSFTPATEDKVELLKVVITNTGSETICCTPTAAIPIYGRSAENFRDHRHVTSLLHRIMTTQYGVEVQPTLSFDERGHKPNQVTYGVVGAGPERSAPVGFFPVVETYIGEGGNLEWPEAVVENSSVEAGSGEQYEGYEAVGALRFADISLKPGESAAYIVALGIREDGSGFTEFAEKYCLERAFDDYLKKTVDLWREKLSVLAFHSGDAAFEPWMKWVTIQPILRRIYGCSFLPHHDYGRGGRGWRDLWQDCLALLMMDPAEVRDLLVNNYAGVRIDGSNATIIGSKPGEFIADRNNISRVWMDHGAWPLLTTKFYIDLSGDLDFLLQGQTYFKDALIRRGKDRDISWRPEDGNRLKTEEGQVYQGTLLEHILLQNLTVFFNVGDHNNIRLEDADWNDGLDMAHKKGESVAFTAFYGNNLLEIRGLLLALAERSHLESVELGEELVILLDTLSQAIDYNSVDAKRQQLDRYFDACRSKVSGRKLRISIDTLAEDLKRKAEWIGEHIRRNEWIQDSKGFQWFNGYYENNGIRVEGDHPNGVRMTLTGQVFTVMGGIADDEQVRQVVRAADQYLLNPETGGYRLNSDFNEVMLNFGRCFGFAYGHKENGAVFSHMAVMYGNALYRRGFVREGYRVLDSLYKLSSDFQQGRIYPGIPEYFNAKGRGMYHYLTGAASWLLMTMLTEVFGVKGILGDLALEPKLLIEQFDQEGDAGVETNFAGRRLEVIFHNAQRLEYGEYRIREIRVDEKAVSWENKGKTALLQRARIEDLDSTRTHRLEIILG